MLTAARDLVVVDLVIHYAVASARRVNVNTAARPGGGVAIDEIVLHRRAVGVDTAAKVFFGRVVIDQVTLHCRVVGVDATSIAFGRVTIDGVILNR